MLLYDVGVVAGAGSLSGSQGLLRASFGQVGLISRLPVRRFDAAAGRRHVQRQKSPSPIRSWSA